MNVLLSVLALTLICAGSAMAGGPAVGPQCYLRSTNSWDRLEQVQYADGTTVYDATYNCRRTDPASGQYYMYFKLNDSYVYNGNYPIVHVSVRYLDVGTQAFQLQYDSAAYAYTLAATVYRTNTGVWKTYTFDIGDALFANRQHGTFDFRLKDCGTALYVDSVFVWCRRESAGVVSVSGGQFENDGALGYPTRFQLVGANYVAPWQTQWDDYVQMWGDSYQSATIERDMGQMEYAGVTGIRVFLPFGNYICPTEGTLNTTTVGNVQDFLDRAQNHGIKVIFSVAGTPAWLNTRIANEYGGAMQPGDYWTSFLYRHELADFLVQLCNVVDFGAYESFLAFDLGADPSISYWQGTAQQFYDSLANPTGYSNATNKAWNRWVNAKYAGLVNAYSAWGYQGSSDTSYTAYPGTQSQFLASGSWNKKIDDYYAFVADSMVETTSYVRSRVQTEALPRAMFTIDFVSRGAYDNLSQDENMVELLCNDWKRCGKACDFINFHVYNGYSIDSNWWQNQLMYLVASGTDKPICVSEYGYYAESGNPGDQEIERRTWQEIMNLAATAKLDGCMGWMWIDTSDPSVYDSDYGIRYIDDTPKPAWNEFTQRKTSFLLTDEPTPSVTVEVDVDSYVSPWEMFYSSGRTLIQDIFDAGDYPSVVAKYRDYPPNDTIYRLPTQAGDPVVGSLGYDAARGAVIMSDTVPDFMVAGMTYTPSITVQNVGTNVWTQAANYRLGTRTSPFSVLRWTLNVGESIPQWGTKTFPMTLTAPATVGTYSVTWQMLQENVAWFGQTHPHTIKVVDKPTHGAGITSYTIPQTVTRSSAFNVSVTVRNEGTTTWTRSANFRLGACDDSDPFGSARQLLDPSDSIASGQSKTFTFQMTAPATKGVYRTDWRMLQEGVTWFGQKIDVEVDVENDLLSDIHAATLNVRDAGALGNGTTDDTAAFQAALDTVKSVGGGIVYVPAGNYMIATHLTIPENVTLEGTFRAPISIKNNFSQLTQPDTYQGSVLLAVDGQGNADGTPFITMSSNSTIKGIAIFHPQQSTTSPVAYPWAIRGNGESNSIIDVELINPWQGVDFATNPCGRHYIRGLYGQPIHLGIHVDQCTDVGRIEDVHFWPFWTIDANSPVRQYSTTYGTGFRFGRTAREALQGCFCYGHNTGFHFVRGSEWEGQIEVKTALPCVTLVNCGPDGSHAGALVEDCLSYGGIVFTNCTFHDKLIVNSTNTGPVELTNCGFIGYGSGSNVRVWGTGTVSLEECHFYVWDVLNVGDPAVYSDADRLNVAGCDFMQAGVGGLQQITLGQNFKSAVVTGNFLRGGRRITVLGTTGHLLEDVNSID
ncbi:MAG: glycosyl hydrolase family 28-related protein [Armatimonadota bacterium]